MTKPREPAPPVVRELPGRGRIVLYDGERYLPEDVTRELARFFLWMTVLGLPLGVAAGVLIGLYA